MGEPQTLIKTNIMFSIVFIVALIALANAHNWVNSPSRSVQANTVSPALPSSTGQPHVQVIAGQPSKLNGFKGMDVMFGLLLLLPLIIRKCLCIQANTWMLIWMKLEQLNLQFQLNMRNIIANSKQRRWKMVAPMVTSNAMFPKPIQITSLVMLLSKDRFLVHNRAIV